MEMEAQIRLENVWKCYGPKAVVCGLGFGVPSGSVYGFLGPNGAGKSTTIRMLLGLQKPTRGTISLFGRPLQAARTDILRRIGSLVESPSLYGHLTGRENLEVHRRLLGLPRECIHSVLETVNLLPAGNQLVRQYSSGMKQRLGIAQALLGSPDLLILDEPTNGLDPAGIHEVRALIRDLPGRRGVTVFLSSHLLSEVEQVATHFAIIAEGVLKFEGTPASLRVRSKPNIVIEVDRTDRALDLLRDIGLSAIVRDGRLLVEPNELGPAAINTRLVRAGFEVSQLGNQHRTLEEVFLELTAAAAPAKVEVAQ